MSTPSSLPSLDTPLATPAETEMPIQRPAVLVRNGGLRCHVGRDARIQMYKETAGDSLSLMTIRSFGLHSNPDEGSSLRLYRGNMTPEEPLDDDVFINANFLAKAPIQNAGGKTAYDQSSFVRTGSITSRCPAEYGAIEATTDYIFRPEGLGSAESEGPGVWRRRSRRRQSLTGAPPHRVAAKSANRTAAGADSREEPCTNALTSRHAGSAGGG